MPKRVYSEIRKAILQALSDGKEHSYGELERVVNTNWKTIRNQCKDLQLFNAVTISKGDRVKITPQGNQILQKLKV
ncbi:hypothetical protein HYY73_02005 [Candidatus Woesearchaeota archaeon]|nr:hypothetical protein [Candidatus Woesearchaeota archaeon]